MTTRGVVYVILRYILCNQDYCTTTEKYEKIHIRMFLYSVHFPI